MRMEEFILKVKNHPALWDSNSMFFRDFARKKAAWDLIVKECHLRSVPQAKILWKRLRDSHREAMRRRKISQFPLAPWKYEENMSFLLANNDLRPEKPRTTMNTDDEVSVSDEEDKSATEHETQDSRNNPIFVSIQKRGVSVDSAEENEREQHKEEVDGPDEGRRRKRNVNDLALKDLFSGLGQKTMMLPRHLQLRVQREVFESVMRAEEEALAFGCLPSLVDSRGNRISPRPAGENPNEIFVVKGENFNC